MQHLLLNKLIKKFYGVINTSGLKIKNFVEKPNIKLNINAGVYVLEKSLKPNDKDKFDMPELYKKIISNKLKQLFTLFMIGLIWF